MHDAPHAAVTLNVAGQQAQEPHEIKAVALGASRPTKVDQQRAQEYFKEAQALCERDGGRLWGVSICAPMVIGDARTQTFATSSRHRMRLAQSSSVC